MDATQPGNLAPDVPPRLKKTLRWRLNRLRRMTPLELAHRTLRAVLARAEGRGLLGSPAEPAPDLDISAHPWVHRDPGVDPAPYLAAADEIAHGRISVFALREVDLGMPPRWNRDPKTGIEAPLVYGKLLDYRNPDLVGDIKYLWEPNRHHELVTLAQAYALSGRRRYYDALVEYLESWFIACPFALGPNWASALEAGIRLANWAVAWQLVQPLAEGDFKRRWLRSVYEHAYFVRHWFSAHSSANNHLIGEAAGLFVAALTWPHWREMREWGSHAKAIVEREALLQNAPDGVNREHALWYHQVELETLLTCLLAGRANGENFSPAFEARLEAMLDFIASLMDARGNVPMFGDADDSSFVRLDPNREASPCRSALALGALLFRRGDFKRKAGTLDDRTRWLLGREAQPQYQALAAEANRLPVRQSFAEGGFFVLGAGLDTPGEIRAVIDAGPLGYQSIAAHGHADALSFTLSVGGREFLVDPGTYAYHTQERWREYFRGTAAHNTVRIDGLDQSEQGGNFMWVKHAHAGCGLWLSSAEKDTFEGWHDGYMRLADPVKHRRLVELDKRARRLVIEDSLTMAQKHDVELLLHWAEDCRIEALADGFLIECDGITLHLALPAGGSADIYRGSLAPLYGWISRGYDRRAPTSTIVWRATLSSPAVLRTAIQIATTTPAAAGHR